MLRCQFCGKETDETNSYTGFISMALPDERMEVLIDKWGRTNWWENFERTDLTNEQYAELDSLSLYDQLLNTVGRGTQCLDCLDKEEEMYKKYYPQNI